MDILQMSISAGILIAAIVIIRAIALNRVPKSTFLVLWGVAILRLFVPISVSSHFSLYSVIAEVLRYVSPKSLTMGTGNMLSTVILLSGASNATENTAGMAQYQSFFRVPINVIWIVGVLAMSVFFTIVYFRNRKELRCALPISNNEFIDKWLLKHKIMRPLAILQSDRIRTPISTGIIKPRIILPKSMDINDEQTLHYILTHEYYHIRRFDAVWKLLLVASLCIHWFNPMVWVMFILANRDLELACDELVIRHFGSETKTAYAYSLIHMAEQRSGFSPLCNGFSRNAIEERIVSIMKAKKITVLSIAIAFVLVMATTVVFATAAATKNNDEEVMPQDTGTDWAVYNDKGELEYYHTVDENGNDVYLDYVPEPQKGDAEMDGNFFVSEQITCENGVAGGHKESNGRMAVYTNAGGTWSLKKGETVTITFNVKVVDGHENGQGIQFGYLKDGTYTEYSSTSLSGETSITFCTPEDGEYNFYFINASSDTIYVNSCSISIL